MARSIDLSDNQKQAQGCSVTGVVSGVAVTHVCVQAAGCSVAPVTGGSSSAIKAAAVQGTGMNADVYAGVAVEAV